MQSSQILRKRIKRSNPSRPCPMCKGTGCGQSGSLVLCWRVESERQAKSGAWIHGEALPYETRFVKRFENPIASIDRRHAVFSALLERLTLSERHAEHLRQKRGLDCETITAAQFLTVPTYKTAQQIVSDLTREHDLSHVPGFYRQGDDWRLRFAGMPGFYLPLRDAQGRIEALQIRRDGDDPKFRYCLVSTPPDEFPRGASSGAPAHFAGDVERAEKLIITEGGLKGVVVSALLNCPVVGLVAAGTFKSSLGWQLRRDVPDCADIAIAFDAPEGEKSETARANVAAQRRRLVEALSRAGYEPSFITWPAEQGKGLDDYLLNAQRTA